VYIQCAYDGCLKLAAQGEMCHTHYEAKRRNANPEKSKRARMARYRRNKTKILAYGQARKMAKLHASPTEQVSLRLFYLNLKTAEYIPCYWCGIDTIVGNRHGDHMIPISRGGKHELSNLCCSCVKCNTTKKSMMPEEFKEKMRMAA
jgi:5-methylcytosine-specific restriction endonuclease McrA